MMRLVCGMRQNGEWACGNAEAREEGGGGKEEMGMEVRREWGGEGGGGAPFVRAYHA